MAVAVEEVAAVVDLTTPIVTVNVSTSVPAIARGMIDEAAVVKGRVSKQPKVVPFRRHGCLLST